MCSVVGSMSCNCQLFSRCPTPFGWNQGIVADLVYTVHTSYTIQALCPMLSQLDYGQDEDAIVGKTLRYIDLVSACTSSLQYVFIIVQSWYH